MKNCPKCGSSQKMSRKTCSECGAKLDYPAKHDNPFDLGIFGKVMVVIDILGVIAAITIMYFFIGNNHVNIFLFQFLLRILKHIFCFHGKSTYKLTFSSILTYI